jgi:D-serine deaminase-like pyridoxal phosphate-dependent protein
MAPGASRWPPPRKSRWRYRFGVRRVLLANQLVAPADIRAVLALLRDDPDFECIVLADSLAGVARLADAVALHPLPRPLPVLVELGLAGKRAGCRTPEAASRWRAPSPARRACSWPASRATKGCWYR